jgi:putative addiction module component (TIGR02574 family)
MMTPDIDDILRLPVDERLAIMEKIWESIQDNEDTNVPDWHLEILRERFEKHKSSLTEGKSWEEVKRRLLHL